MTCPWCNNPGEPTGLLHIDFGIEEVLFFLELILDSPNYHADLRQIVSTIHSHVGIHDQLDRHVQFFRIPNLGLQLRADHRGLLLAAVHDESDDESDDDTTDDMENESNHEDAHEIETIVLSDNEIIEISDDEL